MKCPKHPYQDYCSHHVHNAIASIFRGILAYLTLTYQPYFKSKTKFRRKTSYQIGNHLIAIFLMREGETMLQEENESEIITSLKKKLEVHMARNELLLKENQELREEVVRLKSQIISLKAHNMERKSVLWKKLQKSIDDNNNSEAHQQHKAPPVQVITCEKSSQNENVHTNPGFQDSAAPRKDKPAIVPPAPPPRPSPTLLLPPLHKKEKGLKVQQAIAPPPPPTPPKLSSVGLKTLRRVPEVIELYRSLTQKDANMENRIHSNGIPTVAFTRNMIEEIENRSTYLSAVSLVPSSSMLIIFMCQIFLC